MTAESSAVGYAGPTDLRFVVAGFLQICRADGAGGGVRLRHCGQPFEKFSPRAALRFALGLRDRTQANGRGVAGGCKPSRELRATGRRHAV